MPDPASEPSSSLPLGQKPAPVQGDDGEARCMVNHDLLCVMCGYQLRGLPREGDCPECGASIERAYDADHLDLAKPSVVMRMAIGGTLFWLSLIVAGLELLLSRVIPFAIPLTHGMAIGIPACLFAVGVWLLTTPEPTQVSHRGQVTGDVGSHVGGRLSGRRLTRWLLIGAWGLDFLIGRLRYTEAIPDHGAVEALRLLLYVPVTVAAMIHVANLMARSRDPHMEDRLGGFAFLVAGLLVLHGFVTIIFGELGIRALNSTGPVSFAAGWCFVIFLVPIVAVLARMTAPAMLTLWNVALSARDPAAKRHHPRRVEPPAEFRSAPPVPEPIPPIDVEGSPDPATPAKPANPDQPNGRDDAPHAH